VTIILELINKRLKSLLCYHISLVKEDKVSKRVDIKNKIFNNIYVLEFDKAVKTHARWKCLCMLCNEITYKNYINLVSGNSKSCQRCGQKISNGLEQDIYWDLKKGLKVSHIAQKYKVCRQVVNRIKNESTT
jgi:hypothetical protein